MDADQVLMELKTRLGALTETVRRKLVEVCPISDAEWADCRAFKASTWHELLNHVAAIRRKVETRTGGKADPYAQGFESVEARARDHWSRLTDASKASVVRLLGWDPLDPCRTRRVLDWYDLADLACYQLKSQRYHDQDSRGEAVAAVDKVRELIDGITHRRTSDAS